MPIAGVVANRVTPAMAGRRAAALGRTLAPALGALTRATAAFAAAARRRTLAEHQALAAAERRALERLFAGARPPRTRSSRGSRSDVHDLAGPSLARARGPGAAARQTSHGRPFSMSGCSASLEVATPRREELVEITALVRAALRKTRRGGAAPVAYVPHTTAGITIQENADPDVQHDFLLALANAVPARPPARELPARRGEQRRAREGVARRQLGHARRRGRRARARDVAGRLPVRVRRPAHTEGAPEASSRGRLRAGCAPPSSPPPRPPRLRHRTPRGRARRRGPLVPARTRRERARSTAELAGKNDEELLAIGTAAAGAGDDARAAAAFAALADRLPALASRRAALLEAGPRYERAEEWRLALERFRALEARAGPEALEASFRAAEAHYRLDDLAAAHAALEGILARPALPAGERVRALAQRGVVELEQGRDGSRRGDAREALPAHETASATERLAPSAAAQARFYLGEVRRAALLARAARSLARRRERARRELERKSELLLAAQEDYLAAIRARRRALGGRRGVPDRRALRRPCARRCSTRRSRPASTPSQAESYRAELRREVRVLAAKAMTAYEETLALAAARRGRRRALPRRRGGLARAAARRGRGGGPPAGPPRAPGAPG